MGSAEHWEVCLQVCMAVQVSYTTSLNAEPQQQFCYSFPGGNYKGHVDVLAPTVQELAGLEREAQTSFLHLGYMPNQLFRAF